MQMLTIDANVFFKILHQEHDSAIAEDFLDWCLLNEVSIIVPTLFTYDEKHFKKSQQFGSILLLRDWEQLKY